MKTRFKVGQRVRVRDDLSPRKNYCMSGGRFENIAVPSMLDLRGRKVVIKKVLNGGVGYYLTESGNFIWTDEMFVDPLDNTETLRKLKEIEKRKIARPSFGFFNFGTVDKIKFHGTT